MNLVTLVGRTDNRIGIPLQPGKTRAK